MSITRRLMSSRAGRVIAALLVLLAGLGLAAAGWHEIDTARHRTATSDAEITAVSEVTCSVDITLTVDGRAYPGQLNTRRVASHQDGHHPEYVCSDNGRSSQDYAVGDTIEVAYDPQDPSSHGRPSDAGNSWIAVGGGALMAALGLAGAVRMARTRPASR